MNADKHKPERVFFNKKDVAELSRKDIAGYLSEEQFELILNQCKILAFKPSSQIVKQGTLPKGVYLIMNGEVEISARVLGEGNTKIDTLGPGGIIGGISFIDKSPSPISAVAKSKVTCIYISLVYFDFLNAIDPDAKYKITKAINKQLCKNMKRTHDQAVKYISKSDMVGLSFIGRALHSVTEPSVIPVIGEDDENLMALLQTPLLNIFTSDEKKELIEHSEFLKAPKNCILIEESDKTASCFIVLHGAVQSSILQHSKLAKLSVIGPGSLFAAIGCIDKKSKFTVSFITCETAVLFRLSEHHLNYFKNNKPILWYKLFSLISQSLVALGKSVNKLDVRLHIETYNR